MGNCCPNEEINDRGKKKEIKQFNRPSLTNGLVTNPEMANAINKNVLVHANNFNIYDSVVKKLNFEDEEVHEGNNIISFTTSTKKEYNFSRIYLLGEGTFGKVFLVKNLENDEIFAMKILDKKFISCTNQTEHTLSERKLLEQINNRFIIHLEYAFQSSDKLYFITEFAQGGELYYHLDNEGCFSIERVKLYLAEIIIALNTLHEQGCIYRDLKFENLLLDKEGHIKLTDFGLSKVDLISDKAHSLCGTPGYISPDIYNPEGYDKRSDYFCLGLLMYQMIEGKSPFPELISLIPNKKNKEKIMEIFNKPVKYNNNKFTEEAIALCNLLLKVDANERINNIDQLKSHPFFSKLIYYDSAGNELFVEDFDWMKAENAYYKPIFVPKLTGNTDVRYFSRFFTSQNMDLKDSFTNKSNSYSKGDYMDFTYINTKENN